MSWQMQDQSLHVIVDREKQLKNLGWIVSQMEEFEFLYLEMDMNWFECKRLKTLRGDKVSMLTRK